MWQCSSCQLSRFSVFTRTGVKRLFLHPHRKEPSSLIINAPALSQSSDLHLVCPPLSSPLSLSCPSCKAHLMLQSWEGHKSPLEPEALSPSIRVAREEPEVVGLLLWFISSTDVFVVCRLQTLTIYCICSSSECIINSYWTTSMNLREAPRSHTSCTFLLFQFVWPVFRVKFTQRLWQQI